MKDLKDAIALIETGQVDEAYELLQYTLKSASDDEKFVIVELYEEWGFIEDAIKVLEELLDRYPTEGQLMTKLAELYIEVNNDEQAIHLLNNIQQDDPFYIHALLLLADTYEREGLFEVAEQKLLEAKDIVGNEEAFIIDFALAELFLSIGQAQRAVHFYEKVLQKADDINGIIIAERLAESFTLVGKYEKALHYYDQLTDRDPNRLFKHGFAAYQAKELNRAIELWRETLEIDSHYHPVYLELATVYLEDGQIQEAYDTAKEGLTYDEFDKRLYYLIGQTALHLGDVAESIQSLQEAIALDEDYKEAVLLLASIYEEQNDFEQMVGFLNDIKDLGGADPLYDWKLAKGYNELEQFERAKTLYDEVYFHLENDADFLKEYGYFLIEDGSINEGVVILTTYVEQKPDDIETVAFLERIHFSNDNEI